jgi:hypothetical protein
VVGVLLSALLVVFLHQYHLAHQSRGFLRDFTALRLEMTSYEDVKKLETAYGGVETKAEPDYGPVPSICASHDCLIMFEFSNSWLEHLHLAPPTVLGGALLSVHGVVRARSLGYESRKSTDPFSRGVSDGYKIYPDAASIWTHETLSPEMRRVDVELRPKPRKPIGTPRTQWICPAYGD